MAVRINTQLNPDTNLEIVRPGYINTKKDPLQMDPLFFDQYDFTDQYTDPLHTYTEYGVGPTRFGDWNEERAVQQSTGEKWRRGLAKGAITTLGAVAENTLGVLAGLGEVISGGQYYDNKIGQSIDRMNAWAREEMPNYYTQAEEDMGAVQRMGTANFWADKALNGLGYSLGSIATMALTGGAGYVGMVGNAVKASKIASLGDKAAKIHKLYKVAKTAARGEKLSKMMGQVQQAQKWKNAGQMIDGAIMMSLAESSVESRETKKHVYDSLLQLEMEKQGVEYAADLGAEKLMEIQKDANAAGNANFGMNMGVLSLSNAFMFGKMLGPNYIAGQNAIKGISKTGTGKWVDSTTKGWRKAYKKTKPFLQTSIAEAAQEGSQYASNIAASEFANAKYSDQGGITRMQALHEGLSRTFGETDGIESMLLGAVTGGFMGGAGSLISRPAKSRDQRAEGVLNILNSGAMSSTVERARNQERVLYFVKKMEEAREQGNEELFEQYRTQAIISDAIILDEAGQIDLYYEKLDDTLSLSDEDFAKEFGYNPDAKFDKYKVVAELKKDIALAVKRKNSLDAMFPITQTRGVPRMVMSEEARKEEDTKNMETLMLRDHLLQNAVFLDKVSDRKKDVANRVSEMVPGVTLGLLEKAADNSKERYDSLIEEAILLTEGVTNEQELPQELRDAAAEEAKIGYVKDVFGALSEKTKINPVDQEAIGAELSTYYGLHSNEQNMFENWNRLQTSQGRDSWLRVALMDREAMIKEDADASVEDLIQQETDPEKIAKNTNPKASGPIKRKSKKEAQNINNIKKNIYNKFMDPSVSMKEIDAAIDARAGAEEAAKEGFESTEEKQAYIELQVLREIKKQREANKEQEEENKNQQESAQKSKEVLFTGLFVNSIEKLKRLFKPAHPNEYYTHMIRQERPDLQREEQFIGRKVKLKITGRYKTDRMDVILVEGELTQGDFNIPYIVLSLADGVSLEDVQDALYYANEKGQIKTYKAPKSIDTTFGYKDGNNVVHTDTIEESAPQEQIDSPAIVDEQGQTEMVFDEEAPVAPTIAKEGVSEVFKKNSELSEIGTEEQYSAYLDTVFPSSKVESIKYHGTQREFEEFKSGVSKVSPGTTATDLFWFTNRESAGMYAGEQIDWSLYTPEQITEGKEAMRKLGMTTSRVIPSVLDSKNPFDYENPAHLKIIEGIIKSREDYIEGDVKTFTDAIKKEGNWYTLEKLIEGIKEAGFDGVFALERDDNGNLSKDLAVFSPNQIQILGSTQNIKGFKEFVSKPTQSEFVSKPAQSEVVIEKGIGQEIEFTDDSEFVIFDEEFIDPEVLSQELAAQNAEAAAMRGESTGETEIALSETFEIKLSQEDQRLVDWLKTPEGSLDNQTGLESATKLAIKFSEGRQKARDEGKTEEEADQYMKENLSKELMASIGIGFKAIELGPRLEELNIILKKQNELGVPIQELKSIPTHEQLLILEAEERALLEEEVKLRNSLNKEDENCAT